MRKAIALPYVPYQNEPSVPLTRIIEVPDNVEERDTMLRELLCKEFRDYFDGFDHEIVISDDKDASYGDLHVGVDEEIYIFLTYLEE